MKLLKNYVNRIINKIKMKNKKKISSCKINEKKIIITKDDINKNTIKITKEKLLKKISIESPENNQIVSYPQIDIIGYGHSKCIFKLNPVNKKCKSKICYSNDKGFFKFANIDLLPGNNYFEIRNEDFKEIESQKVSIAINYNKSKSLWIGRRDPITRKLFNVDTDIKILIRCKNCNAYQLRDSVYEYHNCCTCCKNSKEFWYSRDNEFHSDKK